MSTQLSFYPLSLAVFAILSMLVVIRPQSLPASGLLVTEGRFGGELEIKEHRWMSRSIMASPWLSWSKTLSRKENRIGGELYTFFLTRKSAVVNFRMRINRQEMIGKVVEKKRAWKIDKSYKAKQVAPGLLEQVDYTQLELRINPSRPPPNNESRQPIFKNSISTTIQQFMFIHWPRRSHHPAVGSRQNGDRYQLRYKINRCHKHRFYQEFQNRVCHQEFKKERVSDRPGSVQLS